MGPDDVEDMDTGDKGDLTGGFYEVYDAKDILGNGMSSVVRRCVEKSTGREYAVKILDVSTEKSSEEEAAELRICTLREIKILKMLHGHKNIIQIHDFFETPTFLFIVFEIARGGELFDYLTRVVTLSEKKTRSIMRQLLEAVYEMHSRNIIHRDLKPENILMIDDDTIKLTDFGFAYELAPGEKLFELCGTPGYLAPEVLKVSMYEDVEGYSLEVDLWACGVIMYTLLCGYAPFYHRKQLFMLRAITEGNYEFRSPEWDEISDNAKDLIAHLLVVNPADRFDAKMAMSHPFLLMQAETEEVKKAKKFNAKKRFLLAAIQVRSLCRILKLKVYPTAITDATAQQNPYSARKLRKQIDACAFHVYGHWVKKGREQYRDMLFANTPKTEAYRECPVVSRQATMMPSRVERD